MKIAVQGLGPIGIEVARGIVTRPGLELVGGIDVAPNLVGRLMAEIGEVPTLLEVEDSLEPAIDRGVEAVALCTSSRADVVAPQAARAVAAGLHVVSTCEELAWAPGSAAMAELDAAAKRAGRTVVGTGVNPGFVMDRLVAHLASVCVRVDAVRVERVVDAALRREPLRNKVGHGLSVDQFAAGVAAGQVGHVGLRASAELVARALGTTVAQVNERLDPVVGEDGRVLGVRQHVMATTGDDRPILLVLQMSVGAPDPHDRIVVDGDPPLDARIAGGIQGDRATVGAVLHAFSRLARAPRGLCTVLDLY